MVHIIKKADILLIILLIVFGLAGTFFLTQGHTGSAAAAEVTIDGKIYGTYDLSKDRTIDLGTGNILTVKDGSVHMKSATCYGKDCVHQGKIDRPGETIVCLPHKVIVEVKGSEDGYDTVSQ